MNAEFKDWCLEQANQWLKIAEMLKKRNETQKSIERALGMAELLAKLAEQ